MKFEEEEKYFKDSETHSNVVINQQTPTSLLLHSSSRPNSNLSTPLKTLPLSPQAQSSPKKRSELSSVRQLCYSLSCIHYCISHSFIFRSDSRTECTTWRSHSTPKPSKATPAYHHYNPIIPPRENTFSTTLRINHNNHSTNRHHHRRHQTS